MSRPDAVTSIHGTRYRLGHELGRGGEGAVFAVEGDRLAVKLLRDRSPRSRDRLRDRLAMVGRLPLEGLPVARPIEQLRPPHVGYVMELFTGMAPIRSLLRPPKRIGSVAHWYFQGGGLRRRLRILARVAEVLSELHGRGLVYTDLSPSNVSVSEASDAVEVRLIDTDHVHPATSEGQSLYTPRYGPPEVVRRSGVPSSLGDAWTFAVIAFETLALVHPLLGDEVQYGEPEMEEQALEGRLPWIDAEDDERNRSSDGIPRELVLSPRLREAFGRTFGPGRTDPAARPGLARWAERLHAAADRTVTCSECSGSYYCDRDFCPWCDAPRPSFVMARVLLWDPDKRHAGDGGQIEAAPGILRGPADQAEGARHGGHLSLRAGGADRSHHPWHVRPEAEAAGWVRGGPDSRSSRSTAESGGSLRRTDGANAGSERGRWTWRSGTRARHGWSTPVPRIGSIASSASTSGGGVLDERNVGPDPQDTGTAGSGDCPFRGVPPMNVSDVIHGRVATIDLSFADGESFPDALVSKSEVFLHGDEGGEWRIEIGGDVREVEGAAPLDRDALRRVGIHGLPRLAWLVQANPPAGEAAGRILIQVHEFSAALTWGESMDVGVDDRFVEDLRKRLGRSISVESAVEWLAERMLLLPRQPDGPPRTLLSGSPAPDAGKKTAFRLHGSGFAVDVQRGLDDRLRATRVVTERRRIEGDERRPIQLVTAPIRFCDLTLAGQFRGGARTELDQLVAQADSYLGLWQAYNDKEREAVLRRAREFGWVRYSRVERLPDGDYRFHLSAGEEKAADLRRRLDAVDGETLEAGDEVPTTIQGMDSEGPSAGHRPPFTGEQMATRASPPSLTLRPPPERDDRKPPEQGYLFLALGGDEVRMRRRSEAWERIRGCANPMPQLGLMIEGQPVPERRSRNLKPVTKAVRDVFANPTDRQRLALDVALNTPDIALVQGPPGTGKTRVIAALQARLAETDEGIAPGGLSGNTLLTSFQHDAVENAASATRVMGLPAVKVGYRRGSTEARDGVDTWAAETAEAVRAARGLAAPEDSVHAALGTVREIALTYLRTPSRRDDPAAVLREVSETASFWLPAELVDDLARLRTALTAPPADPARRRGPRFRAEGGPRAPDRGGGVLGRRASERLEGATAPGTAGRRRRAGARRLHPVDRRGEVMPRTSRRPGSRSDGRRNAVGRSRGGQECPARSPASP